MKVEIELHNEAYMKVRSIQYQEKDGLFTKTFRHDFRDEELPSPDMAVNILLTSMPDEWVARPDSP